MKVRQVRDAHARELARKAGQRNVDLAEPHPTGFVPAPSNAGAGEAGKRGESLQTSSFSSTGVTGTTWRLNFSSESSSPAATPTS
jgi:hypothetical protein